MEEMVIKRLAEKLEELKQERAKIVKEIGKVKYAIKLLSEGGDIDD